MRLLWLAAAASLIAAPVRADVTARYAMGFAPSGLPPMIVEVNDHGDSRINMGNNVAVLTLDGIAYILMADLNGTFVARQDDVLAIQVEQARGMLDQGDHQARQGTRPARTLAETSFRTVQGGSESVGGRSGTVWGLRPAGASATPADIDFVVNGDADLAPVGRALARQFASSRSAVMQAGLPQSSSAGAGSFDGLVAIFERGTVIRWGRLARLESVDTHPIPASEFVLPSAPLTRAQLEARMDLSQPQPAPAGGAH
jgi:hypothetical protein